MVRMVVRTPSWLGLLEGEEEEDRNGFENGPCLFRFRLCVDLTMISAHPHFHCVASPFSVCRGTMLRFRTWLGGWGCLQTPVFLGANGRACIFV
jgi:hypothetical protein